MCDYMDVGWTGRLVMVLWACEWDGIVKHVWAKDACAAVGKVAQQLKVCAWEVQAKRMPHYQQDIWDGHMVCAA